MTAACQVASELEARGVKLSLVAGRVRCTGPAEALTADVLARLREMKDELAQVLAARAARQVVAHDNFVEHAGGLFDGAEILVDFVPFDRLEENAMAVAAELLDFWRAKGISVRLVEGQPVLSGPRWGISIADREAAAGWKEWIIKVLQRQAGPAVRVAPAARQPLPAAVAPQERPPRPESEPTAVDLAEAQAILDELAGTLNTLAGLLVVELAPVAQHAAAVPVVGRPAPAPPIIPSHRLGRKLSSMSAADIREELAQALAETGELF